MAKPTVQQTTLPDLGQFADDACRVCGAKPEHFAVPLSVFDERGRFLYTHPTERGISRRTRITHNATTHGWS